MDAELLNEGLRLTLGEVCRECRVHAEFIIELVDEGIIEPRGSDISSWRFDGYAVVRIQKATRLRQDLGVNLPGVALALDLLGQIEALRKRPT